jgi:hypothetical protein
VAPGRPSRLRHPPRLTTFKVPAQRTAPDITPRLVPVAEAAARAASSIVTSGCSSRRRRRQRAATRGCRRGSLRATSTVSSSASTRLSCGRSLAAASAESTRSVRWELSKRTGPEVRWRTGASSPLSLERTGAPSPSKEVQPRAADRVIAPVLAVNLPVFDLRLNASDSPVTFPRPVACRKIAYGWPCEVEAPPPSGPRRPNKLMGLLFP